MAMTSQFEREDTVPAGPEPYGSLLALLSDIAEQIEIAKSQRERDEFIDQVMEVLLKQITSAALIVMIKAGMKPPSA